MRMQSSTSKRCNNSNGTPKIPTSRLRKSRYVLRGWLKKNKKLLSDLADKVEESEQMQLQQQTAMAEAADIKKQYEANEDEIEQLNHQMASLTFTRTAVETPDLAATAQAVYTDLLESFDNPLLADDASVAAEKAKLEAVYKTLSDTFAEMSQYKARLDAAANAAATKAAERAAATKPPDEVLAIEGGAAPATGLLANPAALRPDTGSNTARDSPYAARTVVARPARADQTASSDMAGTTAATATAASNKPAKERTKAELFESVAKQAKVVDAAAMDQ